MQALPLDRQHFISTFNGWLFLLFLWLLYGLMTWLQNDWLITESMYYQELGEQLSYERIASLLDKRKQYEWIAYLIIPLVLLLRVLYTCICVFSGAFLENWSLKFSHIWRVALFADLIWLLPVLSKILYFGFQDNYTFGNLNSFYPYSLLALFEAEQLEPWMRYPMYTANLLEIAYIALLIYGIRLYAPERQGAVWRLVAISYGLGLLLWVSTVSFLTVYLS